MKRDLEPMGCFVDIERVPIETIVIQCCVIKLHDYAVN